MRLRLPKIRLPHPPSPRQVWNTSRSTFVGFLDSEKVELFVWPYYIALMWFALQVNQNAFRLPVWIQIGLMLALLTDTARNRWAPQSGR